MFACTFCLPSDATWDTAALFTVLSSVRKEIGWEERAVQKKTGWRGGGSDSLSLPCTVERFLPLSGDVRVAIAHKKTMFCFLMSYSCFVC